MYKKLTQIEVEEKLVELGIKFNPFVYKNIKQKINFYCSKCNNLSERDVTGLLRGRTNCPQCSGNVKYSQTDIENKLREHVVFLPFVYTGMHQIIQYHCPVCNIVKEGQIVHVLNGHSNCKYCSGKAKRTQEQAEKELSDKGIDFLPFIYENNETTVKYKCKGCGALKQSPFISIINGHTLCKECGVNKISQDQNLPQDEIEQRLINIGVEFLPFSYNKRRDTFVKIKCIECGVFFDANLNNIFDKRGSRLCRRCQYSTSTQENELKDFIKSLGFEVEENTKINGTEIDILIPEKNIAFEFNGTYYHSDRKKNEFYHYDKVSICQENGIRLIHIWDYEWINQQQQIKSYIKAQLGMCEHRIFARNCIVREIDYQTAKSLLEYHQQGHTSSNKYIGLFHDDELVLVMLFGKTHANIFTKNMIAEWEVRREICKEGYSVVGGKSKVFNYFVKTYKPQSIVSYVDRAKFTGKSYQIMGFKLHHVNPPRYDWVHKSGLIFKKRQPKIYKEMKTLYNEGKAYKVFDSGRYCFLWKKK